MEGGNDTGADERPTAATLQALYEFGLRTEDAQVSWSKEMDEKIAQALGVGAIVLGLAATRGDLAFASIVALLGALIWFAIAVYYGLSALIPLALRVVRRTDDAYQKWASSPDDLDFKWAIAYELSLAAPENHAHLVEKARRLKWVLISVGLETGLVAGSLVLSVA